MVVAGTDKRSFTLKGKGLLRTLATPCGISRAFPVASGVVSSGGKTFNAIWNTGAKGCVISKKVVAELGLSHTGIQYVTTAVGPVPVNEYSISIFFPNGVVIPSVKATEGSMGNTDALIGMEIINGGDFAITHEGGGDTAFTFQMPSTHHIDFFRKGKDNAQ